MRKLVLLMTLLVALSISDMSAKILQYGVKGGVTLTNLTLDTNFKNTFSSDNRAGFFFGPMVNINLPVGFNVDAALMYAQDKIKYENEAGSVSDIRRIIEVPVNIKWSISAAKIIGFYMAAGPDFAFNLNRGGDIEDYLKESMEKQGISSSLLKNETKSVSIGISVGAGFILFNHLNIGFNYIIPVDHTYKYVIGDTGAEFSSKTKRWQISAAYMF